MFTMQKEEQMLQKRLIELSKIAYHHGRVTFSDFLNLNELHILNTTSKHEFYTNFKTFGGCVALERQIIAFYPDALCDKVNYPITILKISPLNKKFAEVLTHRDYLGALINLGIERCKLGDILVNDTETLVFVHDSLAEYIKSNLTRIKHTTIQIETSSAISEAYIPSFEEIKGTVASVRLDSLLSLAFSSSRSKLAALIEGGKVFVNGRLITTNSYNVNDEDIISVRGLGKFQYKGIQSNTKKGRYYVSIYKYI